MNEFEQALLASVEEYSKGYLQAVKDLRELVRNANEIVKKVTDNEVSLTLNTVETGDGGEFFVLNAEMNQRPSYGSNSRTRSSTNFLRSFEFPGTGYPAKMFVDYVEWQNSYDHDDRITPLASKTQLAEAINALAKDRESPLMRMISYSLRTKETRQSKYSPQSPSEDSEGNGDIPF